ncbi:MAG: AsmA-like C-terminal region-containing protein [Pirellulales bacterium]
MWLIVVLAVLAGILCVLAVQTRFSAGLRGMVHNRLSEMFPGAEIRLGAVTAHGSNGIVVQDVQFGIKADGKIRRFLAIDHVTLRGALDVSNWVQQTVCVHEVELHQPRAELWQSADGKWSLSALNCSSRPESSPPKIRIYGGEVRVSRNLGASTVPLVVHDIEADITPLVDEAAAIQSELLGQAPGAGRLFHLNLTARSSFCDSLSLSGQLEPSKKGWRLGAKVSGLRYSPDLTSKLPQSLEPYLSQLAGLNCTVDAHAVLESAGSSAVPKFDVQGRITQGRLQDPRLPLPLEELSGQFVCNSELLKLTDMKAVSGEARFALSTVIAGFRPNAPMTVVARAEQLQLDARLYNALPERWREYWDRIRPHGVVDADVTLSTDGLVWKPSVTIHCRDVQVEGWLFPYPLTKLNGDLELVTDGVFSQRMKGEAGGQPIIGNFRFNRVDREWYGKIDLSIHGPVAIDEKLLNALTVRGQPDSATERFVRSLEPSGSFILHQATFERRPGEIGPWHKNLDIQIVESSLRYAQFKYPLYDIRGRVKAVDDHWRLEAFEGHNDSGRIQCDGQWLEARNTEVPFELNFTAHTLPMEEELQRALPADAQQLWDEIEPSGTLDRAVVRIARPDGSGPLDIEVTLQEDNAANNLTGQSLRLHPKSFPYWFYDVSCEVVYRPDYLKIVQASASNANSRVALEADCVKSESGNWVGFVKWRPYSRVIVDTQLLRALPDAVSEGLTKLDLRGPVGVMGKSRFELPKDPSSTISTDFDLRLNLDEVQLGEGKDVQRVKGEIGLRGRRGATQLAAVGLVAIDAMSVRGIPVMRMNGPILIAGNDFYFGSTAAARINPSDPAANDITADALSGTLRLSGEGQLDTGRVTVNAKLENADLRQLLQDLGSSESPTDALCQIELNASGIPSNTQTYSGAGKIHLSDAELYQLPLMVRLMRALSITPTDNAAFNSADISFQIDGDRIPLQLTCEGDVLSLRGSGWTNLRRELKLELYSYVGRRVPLSSVLTPVLPESRYATVMMFDVDGTLDSPRVTPVAFPQLGAVQQQIFPDKTEGTRRPRAMLSGFRRWGAEENSESRTTEPGMAAGNGAGGFGPNP